MRRMLYRAAVGALWVLAGCLTALELLLAGCWLRGTRYVMQYGAAENPYAAEDAAMAGYGALLLLPLALAALAWMFCRMVRWYKIRAGARGQKQRR